MREMKIHMLSTDRKTLCNRKTSLVHCTTDGDRATCKVCLHIDRVQFAKALSKAQIKVGD